MIRFTRQKLYFTLAILRIFRAFIFRNKITVKIHSVVSTDTIKICAIVTSDKIDVRLRLSF